MRTRRDVIRRGYGRREGGQVRPGRRRFQVSDRRLGMSVGYGHEAAQPLRHLERLSRQARGRISSLGWIIGAIFFIAVVVAVIFYDGRDVGHTTSPANAPSVTTGSSGPGSPNR